MYFGGAYAWLATVGNGGSVQNTNGYDIWFSTDGLGKNLLPFERVKYVPTTGACEFWVQIPTINSAGPNTVIYINYGDSTVTSDKQNRTAVWDSHYKAVWHFGDGTTLDLTDSTANHNNMANVGCTAGAGLLSSSTGVILHPDHGGGMVLNGSSNYATVNDSASLSTFTTITIEFREQFPANFPSAVYQTILQKKGSPTSYALLMQGGSDVGSSVSPVLAVTNATGLSQRVPGTLYHGDAIGALNWGAVSWDNVTTAHWWVDSGSFAVQEAYGSPQTWTAPAIGNTSPATMYCGATATGTQFYQGTIDELRISDIQRSTDWLGACDGTSSNPGDVGNVGGEPWFYGISGLVGPFTACNSPALAVAGTSYSQTLTASGGAPPYTFALTSGSLPPGLTFASSGVISGTPTTTGVYSFSYQVTDSASASATSGSCPCIIAVGGAGGGGGAGGRGNRFY